MKITDKDLELALEIIEAWMEATKRNEPQAKAEIAAFEEVISALPREAEEFNDYVNN